MSLIFQQISRQDETNKLYKVTTRESREVIGDVESYFVRTTRPIAGSRLVSRGADEKRWRIAGEYGDHYPTRAAAAAELLRRHEAKAAEAAAAEVQDDKPTESGIVVIPRQSNVEVRVVATDSPKVVRRGGNPVGDYFTVYYGEVVIGDLRRTNDGDGYRWQAWNGLTVRADFATIREAVRNLLTTSRAQDAIFATMQFAAPVGTWNA